MLLRAPPEVATKIRSMLRSNEHGSHQLELRFIEGRTVHFVIDGETYHGKLVDMPCNLETHKTTDKMNFVKSADVGQVQL